MNTVKNVWGAAILFFLTTVVAFASFSSSKNRAEELETALASTTLAFESTLFEKNELVQKLGEKEKEIEELNKDFKRLDKKTDELEKLAKTDKQLLEKYSKVYFLNEHYTPERLKEIDSEYLSDPSKKMQIHAEVLSDLEDMIEDAKRDKITLTVSSGYRSFDTQASLKTGYVVTYGAGTANQFSAEQGYSEHQLGTAVDLTTPGYGLTTSFEKSEAFKWLTENAYRYGFTLSYPKGNAYYQYEPWHWRFVGKDLARKLHRNNQYFYDMDQREINEYLVDIFD